MSRKEPWNHSFMHTRRFHCFQGSNIYARVVPLKGSKPLPGPAANSAALSRQLQTSAFLIRSLVKHTVLDKILRQDASNHVTKLQSSRQPASTAHLPMFIMREHPPVVLGQPARMAGPSWPCSSRSKRSTPRKHLRCPGR